MAGEIVPVTHRAGYLQRRPPAWTSAAAVAGLLLAWELLGRLGLLPRAFLPPPSAVLLTGAAMVGSGEVAGHLAASLGRIAAGLLLGGTTGCLAGLLFGASRYAERIGMPLVSALFPIPKIALLPLLILWLGIGEAPKVAIIALGVFFPMAINSYAGVRQADPNLVRAAIAFGATPRRVLWQVLWPSALPMVFAGLRLATGTALLLLVSAEMIGADRGLGYLILHAGDLMLTDRLVVGLLVLSLLGVLLAAAAQRLERALLPWRAR